MSVKIYADMSGINRLIDQLETNVEEAVLPAAAAAARVLYAAVQKNVEAIGQKSGNLRASIYRRYSRETARDGFAAYTVSWNHIKAPHGHLLEYGHVQRYVTYINRKGEWKTAIRKGMEGKPKPPRGASQATKDAYYVPLPTPKHVAARPFLRPAAAYFPQAVEAAKQRLLSKLGLA